jgi:thioredoxin 1
MQTISEQEFDQEVLGSEKAVLVDFYADWCGPCHMMTPVLEELASERSDLDVVKVDIDEHPNLAARYGVQSIPTMILFRDGEPQETVIGARPKGQLISALGLAGAIA